MAQTNQPEVVVEATPTTLEEMLTKYAELHNQNYFQMLQTSFNFLARKTEFFSTVSPQVANQAFMRTYWKYNQLHSLLKSGQSSSVGVDKQTNMFEQNKEGTNDTIQPLDKIAAESKEGTNNLS